MEIKKVRKEGEEGNTKKTTWCGHGHRVGRTMWAINGILLSAVGYRAGWRQDRREGRTGEEKREEEREAVGERCRRSWEQHTLAERCTGQIHFTHKPLHT